jgi:hypothetical protein
VARTSGWLDRIYYAPAADRGLMAPTDREGRTPRTSSQARSRAEGHSPDPGPSVPQGGLDKPARSCRRRPGTRRLVQRGGERLVLADGTTHQ